MHFLIVNDDGINSPFLPILTQAVKRAGHRVTVCVPATQQSAKAHAFSIERRFWRRSAKCPMRMKRGQFSVRRWTAAASEQ